MKARSLQRLGWALSLVSLSVGCGTTGVLFSDVVTPGEYGKLVPATEYLRFTDRSSSYVIVKRVSGEACSSSILGLFAAGDSGYEAAIKEALAGTDAEEIVDVRVDHHTETVLFGAYSKRCT